MNTIQPSGYVFKPGDIVKNIGFPFSSALMVVEEVVAIKKHNEWSVQEKIHGSPIVYKMRRLISSSDRVFSVSQKQITVAKLANDDDIINELISQVSNFEISDSIRASIDVKNKSFYIHDGENFIYLSEEQIRSLKNILEEIN